jgi:ABC-2 type transport system ATP-binding protein
VARAQQEVVAAAVEPLLAASGITHRYGAREVLCGLSFEVARGEAFGFLGPNGAGKTTTFHILCGLTAPSGGELRLGGMPVGPGDRRLRTRMGVVFQSLSLDLKLTARENLLLGAALYRLPRQRARARADELLGAFELADRAGDAVQTFSGGMRRRLEIARALIHRPEILVMDEPTSGLDEPTFQRTWRRLDELRRDQGLTVLVTTHRPEEAERCSRLAVLAGGRIIACETPEALRSRVAGDVVLVEAEGPEEVARVAAERLGVDCQLRDGRVVIERERGHELIPRLVEAFPPGRLRSVGLRRPSLGDAFVKLTGRDLTDEEKAR